MEPSAEKLEKKALFSAQCKNKALLEHVVASSPQCGEKIELFFQFSPWRDAQLRPFSGYPFGASRKKASAIFYNTAKNKTATYSDRAFFFRAVCRTWGPVLHAPLEAPRFPFRMETFVFSMIF